MMLHSARLLSLGWLRKTTARVSIRVLSSSQPPALTGDLKKYLSHLVEEHHVLQEKISSHACSGTREHPTQLYQRLSMLEPVVKLVQQLKVKENEMRELEELLGSQEEGLKALAHEEQRSCSAEIQSIEKSLIRALVPRDEADTHSAILEVRAGAGGREASLFAAEVFHMYQMFASYKHWQFEVLELDASAAGGYKHASASLSGVGVFGVMKHESGVHRVQRVPVTEGAGRTHTSTMSVAILPQPSEIDVELNPNDLKVETHRSSGPGGQSVNTTDSAVRLTHLPTGLVVHIQDDRSQHKNRASALKILRARLYERRRKEAETALSKERKSQIGSGERHERIRTYNFLQDRVTDHRIGITVHGVTVFMEGGEELENIIEHLQAKEVALGLSKLLATEKHR